MDAHQTLLARLAKETTSKIVLLVLDGVGDLRTPQQPQTALEAANLPNMDALAKVSSLGRLVPVATGITPGSGPGHLALFGYDPTLPETDIGRGVLEALGLGLTVGPEDVAVRGNFATADADGLLTDRRAGRIPTAECERLCQRLSQGLAQQDLQGLDVEVHAGEGHRFVLLLRGDGLDASIADTDPQATGKAPMAPVARRPQAAPTAQRVAHLVSCMEAIIADEPKANRVLLRGFSKPPSIPSWGELYKLRCGAFAGYPLYRGVAGACGMEVVPCGKRFADLLEVVEQHFDDFDFFFLHVKQTDAAGEDGDLATKVAVLEEVDADLHRLLALKPDVLAITGDHSTPAPMAAHSWHPVPLLLQAAHCFVDDCVAFDESQASGGTLGTLPARDLVGLMLAHANRLKKFGA